MTRYKIAYEAEVVITVSTPSIISISKHLLSFTSATEDGVGVKHVTSSAISLNMIKSNTHQEPV